MCDVVARATVLWRAGFDHVDMGQDRQANVPLVRLPREIVDRLARPFSRFLRIETAGGAILLSFTIAALILSNSPWAQPFLSVWETRIGLQIGSVEVARSLKEWINDGLMTLFFFLIALELKRELVLGELAIRAWPPCP